MDAGLDSLKIEGRAKIRLLCRHRHRRLPPLSWTMRRRAGPWTRCGGMRWSTSATGPTATGFYYGYPGQYYENSRYIREWQVVALVTECDADGNAVISLRNKFRTGDTVELVGPDPASLCHDGHRRCGMRPEPLMRSPEIPRCC